MKKNVLIKGILLLIIIVFLTIGFTGCGSSIIITTTGTVYIVLTGNSWYYYDVYMDYNLKFSHVSPGTGTLNNVPIGNHFFQAIDTWGAVYGYDSVTQYIHAGVNYVYLYP